MSGIVGIVHFDGSPAASSLLRTLTDFLVFRGPDAQRTWVKGNVGFGHTLFKTTEESERDCQPLTLDGSAWIVADARIDAREELFASLQAAGEPGIARASWTDAELILRAYDLWGVDCVEHLLGDFSFGIWDEKRQQLFCARDHMGVKPFYYAQLGSCIVFSNTLGCIRQHPLLSDRLNDLAIADFLLFGFNQNPATTSFADIQRLPPAHCATWSRDCFDIRGYWSMPIDEPIFYKRADDYTDQFHDLLRKSVADRLRTNQVGIFMSGGIDSPTIAAVTRDVMRERYATFRVRALTRVDSFVPDERVYAGLVATHLGIPIDYQHSTDIGEFDWEHIPFSLPEPCPDACFFPSERQFWSQLGSYSRVFLYGEGPDNALMLDWRPCLAYLVRQARYGLLLRGAISTLLSNRCPPFWGRISRRIRVATYLANSREPDYPMWLNANLESRLQLRERWITLNSPQSPIHPIRPKGYASLQTPLWQVLFERFDPDVTQTSFEVRHPFVDIRLLRFLLSVPALPWCRSKYLVRKAMRGSLPKEVLHRRKATIDARPLRSLLQNFCAMPFLPTPEIYEFVDPDRLLNLAVPQDVESNLRVRSLNHWLQNSYGSPHNRRKGILCDRFAQQTTPTA
jgi:asparagine synthase (glutamine-hydrolysing)